APRVAGPPLDVGWFGLVNPPPAAPATSSAEPSMKHPAPAVLSSLREAAELRVGGHSWEAVGERLRRSPETCRHWPLTYPEQWQALYRAAEERLINEAGAEAVLVLRQLLRSQDEKVRRHVAKLLATMRLELLALKNKAGDKATDLPESDAERVAAFLTEQSAESINELVEELLDQRRRSKETPA